MHELVLLAFALPTIFIVLRVHDRLKTLPSMKRIGLGVTSLCLAGIVVAVTTVIRPMLHGRPNVWDFVVMTSSALFSGFFVLSVLQIWGGAVRGFKRWRGYRRIATREP